MFKTDVKKYLRDNQIPYANQQRLLELSFNKTERDNLAVLLAIGKTATPKNHLINLCQDLLINNANYKRILACGEIHGVKNLQWAIQRLKDNGSIVRVNHGCYVITNKGEQELKKLVFRAHELHVEHGFRQGFTDTGINCIYSLAHEAY